MTPPWRRLSTALYGPAIIVLLLGGLGSIGAAMMLRGHNDARQEEALRDLADGAVSELRLRMQIYEYGLKGARGTIIGMGDQISRERFRKYAESRDLAHEFPGALGYGFVRRVTPTDEARFVDEARRDGAPEFTIRSFAPHPGDRFVIQYIEPERDNAPAIGLDVASEPLRRAAAVAAVSTGASTLTAPIKLVQLQVDATGFLMFLPVYRDAEPASNASHREVIGWAYTALAITRILHVLDDRGEFTMRIADVSSPGDPVVMFSSPGSTLGDDDSGSSLTVQRIVPMYGRSWRVEIYATRAFLTHLDLPSPWVLGTSIMVSAALLAGLIVTVQWSLRRQLRLSAERDRLAAISARLTEDLEARVLARTDELRAANAQLASVARQLQVAQRITHVGSWECNIADDSWRWSEELFRILGLPPQQQVPAFSTLETMLMPESWAMLSAAMQHSIATGDGYELTLEIVRPGGEHRTAIARCEALRDATGAMEKLVGTIQDVTELARVRTELVTASERLQVATSAARLGVWEWNLRDNVVVWDDMMHSLYNTRREDWEGAYEAWLSGVHPDDLAMVKAELQAALAGTGEIHSEFRIVWKSGEVRYLHPVATVQRDPDTGKPLRVIGANWDVTEQRVAELALRKSEALQRGLLAHAGFAIIVTDCMGMITLFNHAAEAMFGYTAAEVVGGPIPPGMHDPEEINARREALERELGHPLESPLDVFVFKTAQRKSEAQEWTCFHRDGTRVPVLLTVGMLRDDAGEILGRLGVGVDLTSHKQHEAELVELNRLLAERSVQAESASHAKSMFLANMSHEIRTPMNAITGVTYLLNQTQLSPDQHDLVRTLQSGTKTLLGMINDILDLSKIEAGQLTLDEGPFRLSQVLDDLGAMMAALAADKRLELVIQTDDEAPEQLIGDAMRLTQILTNLVGNAIKFTDAGTVRLGVRVASTNDARISLRFEVQDTGPGIAEPMLHRLFTPFTQVDQPGARRAGGTGLGLAIVKQLATLMRGEVGVESTPGTGSVFWCRIPFARVTAVHHVAWPRNLELLIVEPHTGQREVLASYARRCGWRVQEADSNDDVVSRVHAQARAGRPFDAVILDCNPPGLRGLLVLNAIRESPSLARQPAVVLTTLHDVAAVRAHHGAQRADVVIGKPITSSSLFNAVTEAVGAHAHPGEHTSEVVHASDHGQRLAGTRLLVVDDSKLNQIVVGRIMEREGAAVEIAGDGLQAVSRIQAAPGGFDAVLMDVQMPELDGIEATRRIRCISACAHLPIIAVTAGAMASERQLALAAGVNEVISKPFDPEVVVVNVRKYIHQVRDRTGPVLWPVHRKAPPSDWPDWPAVDGIDANDVALRLDGDVEMFRSLLALFIGDLDELERTLSTPPSGEQVVQIAQRLHKLRGTAGNLGARDLYAVANDTEQALREERMPAAIEGLHRVLEQLARLRRSVTGLLDANAPSATDATTGSSLDQARSTPIV